MSDDADLFAIPDFWKPPSWNQQPPPLAAHDRQDGFFGFDVAAADEPVTFFLGRDVVDTVSRASKADALPAVDDSSLFRIPDLLSQMLPADGLPDKPPDNPPAGDSPPKDSQPSDTASPDPDPIDDIWLFAADNADAPSAPPEFKTWAAFERADVPTPAAVFGTEQGPLFVDALVAENADKNSPVVLDTHGYCASLLALALGRSSVLFAWDATKKSFVALLPTARISGFSGPLLRSVEQACVACGNDVCFLRAFVDKTYAAAGGTTSSTSSASPTSIPSRVALARALDGLLLAIQRELGARGQTARSLLQLQALVQPVAALVHFVRGLVARLARAFALVPPAQQTDELFLGLLFHEAQSLEYSVAFMRDTIKRLLQVVSAPWLGFVAAWIGLDAQRSKATLWTGQVKSTSFVRVDDGGWDDYDNDFVADYIFDDARMPAFIPDEMRRDLFETGRNLRFLWTNHPEHPLSDMATVARARPPPLQWQFDWDAIHALNRDALAYERQSRLSHVTSTTEDVQQAASDSKPPPGSATPTAFHVFGRTEEQIQQSLQASMAQLDGPLQRPGGGGSSSSDGSPDDLSVIVRRQLFDEGPDPQAAAETEDDAIALDEFAPHWSLLPLLSFGPVVAAQARLVNRACMQLLFREHGLREHLQLQREFQLLGNGMFCSRLAHALFDPDRAGVDDDHTTGVQLSSRGLGLRLSSRSNGTWPPASSELRLALMGILAQSWSRKTTSTLPISFAVRDLAPEEMDRCMDPDALEALDFLRLTYTPPAPLRTVMTPALLDKYDCVFRLLLTVLRMYYVVNELARGSTMMHDTRGAHGVDSESRSAKRFRIESRHFVANIMAYFWGTGVDVPWRKFEAWLDGVSRRLEGADNDADNDADTDASSDTSPEKLRARHEQVLDEILLALLLRKRQQPLLLLLQGIFRLILEFAKHGGEEEDIARRMHSSFRKKVAAFVAVCRGLSEKEADSVARKDYQHQQQFQDGSRAGEGSALSQLVLMLDYNGMYGGGGR